MPWGVVVGSPAITLLAAWVNRRTLLLGLVALFLIGNGLSALAPDIVLLVVFRFVAGSVQGAFFGAGASSRRRCTARARAARRPPPSWAA
ncbi:MULTISPECIES: hypothetical protein [unclassified Nonomuraea]|uniref:hypothetical protein n=1 Tax=unclassified Nonomuraea TaxID=2593643 RepID=UPI0033F5EB7C